MKRGLIILFGVFLFICSSYAQTDSSKSNLNLTEVIISKDGKEESNEAFNFFRSSKIAGTEEILNKIEGVNLIRRGAFGMEPTLRTYSAGQINITLNGMKMYGACTDKMDPVTVYTEPGNMAMISVKQGASGSMNGSTIGGGMDMQLKEATFYCHKVLQVNAYSQWQSANNGFNNGIVINTNNTKNSIRLNWVHRIAGNYTAGNQILVNHSSYEKHNVSLSYARILNNNHTLIVDVLYDRGMNMGYPALPMDVKLAAAQIYSIAHRYQKNVGIVRRWESKVYFNSIYHEMDDTHRKEALIHMDMPGESRTMGYYSEISLLRKRMEYSFRTDGHQAYTFADMTMYYPGSSPMYMQTLTGNFLTNFGFSGLIQYHLNTFIKTGVQFRGDYYQHIVTNEFGINQMKVFNDVRKQNQNYLKNGSLFIEFTKGRMLNRLMLAYGERVPTSNERLGYYLFNKSDGYDYVGAWKIKPESSLQIEYKLGFENKNTNVSLTLFRHHLYNYIYAMVNPLWSAMTVSARGVKFYMNIDYADLAGFEAHYTHRFNNHFIYTGNARFTYAWLSNGQPMQQVPPLKLLNTVRYQRQSLQFQFEHTGCFNQDRINKDFGEVRTNGFNLINVRTAYMWKFKKTALQLNAAIENIFDIYYREHLDWGGIPRMGRNLALGVNFYLN